jgi:hypothetical protein
VVALVRRAQLLGQGADFHDLMPGDKLRMRAAQSYRWEGAVHRDDGVVARFAQETSPPHDTGP